MTAQKSRKCVGSARPTFHRILSTGIFMNAGAGLRCVINVISTSRLEVFIYTDYDHHITEVDCTAQPLSRPDANRARFLSDPYGMSPADEAEIQRPGAAFVSHARGPHRPENLQPPRPRAASELDLDPERIISNRREELNQLLEEMRSKGLADLHEHGTFEHISEFDSEHEIGSERTLSTIPQDVPTPVEFSDASRPYGRPDYDDQLQRAIQASLEESEVQQDVHDMESMTEEERMLNEAILKSLQEH